MSFHSHGQLTESSCLQSPRCSVRDSEHSVYETAAWLDSGIAGGLFPPGWVETQVGYQRSDFKSCNIHIYCIFFLRLLWSSLPLKNLCRFLDKSIFMFTAFWEKARVTHFGTFVDGTISVTLTLCYNLHIMKTKTRRLQTADPFLAGYVLTKRPV